MNKVFSLVSLRSLRSLRLNMIAAGCGSGICLLTAENAESAEKRVNASVASSKKTAIQVYKLLMNGSLGLVSSD
mgnify:CR=1 FL=1